MSETISVRKILSAIIPAIPIIIYYYIPLTSIGFDTGVILLLALYVGYCQLAKHSLRICQTKMYIYLVIWTILVTTFFFVAGHYEVNYGIGLWYIVLALMVVIGSDDDIFDKSVIIKSYIIIAKIVLGLLAIQWVLLLVFGLRTSFMLHFLPINPDFGTATTFITNGASSLSACFSERSHLALFLTPYLCLSLSNFKEKRCSWIIPVIVTIAIMSTTSGNGVIGCAIAWISYVILSSSGFKRILLLVAILVLVFSAYLFLLRIPEFSSMFGNLFSASNQYSHSKADYRIYRGFTLFRQLPSTSKIFGIGYRCLADSMGYYQLTDTFGLSGEYMGCISQILVYSGYVGMFIFVSFIVKLFKDGNDLSRTILIVFIAYCFSSSIYNDSIWILYLTLIIIFNTTHNIIFDNCTNEEGDTYYETL